MDKEIKSINEIISDNKDDPVRQDDIAWSCLEGELYGQNDMDYDIPPYPENEYPGDITYQESEYYNPFADSED